MKIFPKLKTKPTIADFLKERDQFFKKNKNGEISKETFKKVNNTLNNNKTAPIIQEMARTDRLELVYFVYKFDLNEGAILNVFRKMINFAKKNPNFTAEEMLEHLESGRGRKKGDKYRKNKNAVKDNLFKI